MFNPTKLLDALQADWPLLDSLAIVGIAQTPPQWAMDSAQRFAAGMRPAELSVCRSQLPRQIQFLRTLHQRWIVTTVLAILLGAAVVANSLATPPDSVQLGVLIGVLSAILLPPLVICNGIARDYVAARALASVLGGVADQAH
ncbi:MAG TPA: hypothetical protein VFX76_21300 [Roseiflexaceae bacterium]|nr:hypothetical protein [Roseiflexaceae bacterium]